MSVRLRLAVVAFLWVVTALAIAAPSAFSSGGALTGTWSGSISRSLSGTGQRRHLEVVINANERGGSWKVSASCRGPLKLQSISDGFHHYLEKLARGSTCLGGGVDCLERAGAELYDEFQPAPTTSGYTSEAILRRVKG